MKTMLKMECNKIYNRLALAVFFFSLLSMGCERKTGNECPSGYLALLADIPTPRIAGNNFEAGEEIGLYVVPYTNDNTLPGEISATGYAANARHIFDGTSWLLPSGGKIAWPDGAPDIDLYAYYPYDVNLDGNDPRNYLFTIQSDQSQKTAFDASDFLWAKAEDISITLQGIPLSFNHRLSKIRLNITSTVGFDAGMLENATFSFNGIKTTGVVDLSDGSVNVSGTSATGNVDFLKVTPAEGFDLAAEMIAIPQSLQTGGTPAEITIIINNTRYRYQPDPATEFVPGNQHTYNITISALGLTVTTGEIGPWQQTDPIDGSVVDIATRILDLNDIDWSMSKVFRIFHRGNLVGEAHREYVYRSGTVDYPAIVLYPANADGKIDLSQGFIARVMNRTRNSVTNEFEINPGAVHGGQVAFGEQDDLVSYTAGTSPVINKVEFQDAGIVAAADTEAAILSAVAYRVTDVDNNEYPVVKIGTQYWLAENLKVEHYNNGEDVEFYYYNNDAASYKNIFGALYRWSATVDSRGLCPEGWVVPANTDIYDSLWIYTRYDAGGKLKSVTYWNNTSLGDDVTGFNAQPGGYRNDAGTFSNMYNQSHWWTTTTSGSSNAYRLYLASGDRSMHNDAVSRNYAKSIRCIRKP